MKLMFDDAGDRYTVLRVRAPVSTAFSYEMRPEFNGEPHAFVYYHAGRLHRFCPGGQPCNAQGAGAQADPFDKVGTYNFIVFEDAEWDCVAPKAAFPERVRLDVATVTGYVEGDVFLSAGAWRIDGSVQIAPLLIRDLPAGSTAEALSAHCVLFSNIRTEPY